MRFAIIRDCVQAQGLRAASSGLCPLGLIRGGISHVSTLMSYPSRIELRAHRVTPILKIVYSHREPLVTGGVGWVTGVVKDNNAEICPKIRIQSRISRKYKMVKGV